MLDHRMAGKSDLARHLHALVAGLDRGKRDAGIHHVLLDAVEAPEEIEVPPGAAELAVGHGLEPDLLLPLDDALDLAVFDRLELGRRDLGFGAFFARLFENWRAQQA